MNWHAIDPQEQARVIHEFGIVATVIGPSALAAIEFLKASTKDAFADEIVVCMGHLREGFRAWRDSGREPDRLVAIQRAVTLHYMVPVSHPERSELDVIRKALLDGNTMVTK